MATKKQGTAYSGTKVLHFLTHALVIVPINTDEWQNVVDKQAKVYPETIHGISSLKQKFQALPKLTGPSGNPNCPVEVRLEKKIMNSIRRKAEAGGDDNIPRLVEEKNKDEGNVSKSYNKINNDYDNENDNNDNDDNDDD